MTGERRFPDIGNWLDYLSQWHNVRIQADWEFVWTLTAGIEQFGADPDAREDLYQAASEQVGLNVKTLKNYVGIGRQFPKTRMDGLPDGLSIGHCDAVTGLVNEAEQEHWLHRAIAKGWSVHELRSWVYGRSSMRDTETKSDVPYSGSGSGNTGGQAPAPVAEYEHGEDTTVVGVPPTLLWQMLDLLSDLASAEPDTLLGIRQRAEALREAIGEIVGEQP